MHQAVVLQEVDTQLEEDILTQKVVRFLSYSKFVMYIAFIYSWK